MVLIVEDDVSFKLASFWPKTLTEYIAEFPPNWQCVTLYNMACYIEPDLPNFISIKDKLCWGSVAYIINRNGMKAILEGMSDQLIMDKNDPKNFTNLTKTSALADVFIFNRMKHCYTKKFPLFYPDNTTKQMDSTIHPDHTKDHKIISLEIINLYTSVNKLTDLK